MTDSIDDLPDDIAQLKAMVRAERAEKTRLASQNDRLAHMLRQLRRNHFGRKSERLGEDQLNLGLEDLETAIACGEVSAEKGDATLSAWRTRERRVNRGHRPAEQGMPVLRRRSACHRRGRLGAPRQGPRKVSGDRDAAAKIRMPNL